MKTKNAFTLTEVLIVVGIIAVLAGVLLPVLSSAKENSLRTVSSSQLRQIALATILYASDHSDVLPFYRNHEPWLSEHDPEVTNFGLPTNSKQPWKLVEVLLPYMGKERKLWFCPADKYAGKVGTISYPIPGGGVGYANELNHQFSSYLYTATPLREPETPTPFPLVISFGNINPDISLFVEPIMIVTHSEMKSYWNAPVALNVMSDTRVVVFNIPQ